MRGLEKNYMKRGQETAEKQTLRLYERIGLRADALKILSLCSLGEICLAEHSLRARDLFVIVRRMFI